MEYNSSEIVLFIYLFNLSNRMEVERKNVGLYILNIAAKNRANKKRDRLPSPQDVEVICNLMQVIWL